MREKNLNSNALFEVGGIPHMRRTECASENKNQPIRFLLS